jgi:hypothetical protein
MLVIEDTEGKFADASVRDDPDPFFPTRRIEARQLAADMMTFVGREDWYYERVHSRPNLMRHHDRRHVIRIHQTFQQLRKEGREKFQWVDLEPSLTASAKSITDETLDI